MYIYIYKYTLMNMINGQTMTNMFELVSIPLKHAHTH